ncbi:glycine betaine ABC transporter substrate-binding protein [Limnochorda pilosa]|uniref:Glycine/betaine ABC transporter substrate-binding protein n=1 Tax=Limnochorda pilosa TaxID=1555112 RepID=A0A0K2SIL2_LIMPI|nr:glycine betaine ABC transporter substrate-binding protein [Limnochorda pilosa]BAS26971.1 glycine/betaine ABC transporter substrate-binding protein [Limnochorda pilosa]
MDRISLRPRALVSLTACRTAGWRHALAAAVLLAALVAALAGPAAAQAEGELTIGWIPWDEDIAATYLWKTLLEEQGYSVNLVQLDVAPLFAGLAAGNVDVFLDSWLPVTHGTYWERFGEEIDDLGVWYDQAVLGLAVPSYVPVDSLDDLAANAARFGRRIVGIDAGAGLMRITRNDIMPAYGLADWQLLEGSTPAMLAELDRAISRKEWTVVTLWSPHWAFAAHDIKYLKDPKGIWPPAEEIHVLARKGFAGEFPDVARWLGAFKMGDMPLGTLEALIKEQSDAPEAAVRAWLEGPEHRALVDGWIQ